MQDDEEKGLVVKFPSLEYSEGISDISERPPAFLNRMQNFKDELERMKVEISFAYVVNIHWQNL